MKQQREQIVITVEYYGFVVIYEDILFIHNNNTFLCTVKCKFCVCVCVRLVDEWIIARPLYSNLNFLSNERALMITVLLLLLLEHTCQKIYVHIIY